MPEARHLGHDGGVGNPQPLDAANPELGVDDGFLVDAHLARAGRMLGPPAFAERRKPSHSSSVLTPRPGRASRNDMLDQRGRLEYRPDLAAAGDEVRQISGRRRTARTR